MKIVTGKNLEDLWLNLLLYTICDEDTLYYHPTISIRNLFAETNNFEFGDQKIFSSFIKYSGYNISMKIGQLRKEYYTGKVEKQFKVIKENFHQFIPRQARAAIYFSEPAFDSTSKLKCLESLYLLKTDKTHYEAYLVFRNTEIFPKLFMDFYYIHELLKEIDNDTKVKCIGFKATIVNAFVNLHQVKLIEMIAREWGISNFSSNFKKMINEFNGKFNIHSADKTKLVSIKRVLNRTFNLVNEREYNDNS